MGNCGCKGPCNCGSCGSTKIVNTGCCGSQPKQQCCSPVLPCTLTPFFAQSPTCQEDNVQNIIYEQFRAELTIANSWNIPDCGGSAVLSVSGLRGLLIGSYLWNGSYGYFQVIGFNAATNQVTIQNNCNDGNAEVGTQVPACSEFVVVDPPSTSGGTTPTLFPYVAIDFTAPAVSACIDITVTTVNGLAVGKNVQIGSGIYRLASIPSSTIINICNDGTGITPGTPVIAQNAQGQFQYPIVLIDTNPCTNDAATQGALIVCNGNVAVPLDGVTAGSVPVLIDPETNYVEFQALSIPTRTCTSLTACLVLTPGTLEYTLVVADSSQFEIGDILQIGTRTDRYTVTSIPDATHLIVLVDTNPGTIQTINPGTSVCIVDCCEIIIDREIPCAPKLTLTEIPVRVYILTADLDENGYYTVEFSALPDSSAFATVDLPEPPGSCVGVTYAYKGHVSAATAVKFVPGEDLQASMYQEIQVIWQTNPINPYSGKTVWWTSMPGDVILVLPDDDLTTLNQLTTNGGMGTVGIIPYHQNDIEGLGTSTAPVVDNLLCYYRLQVGSSHPPFSVSQIYFMFSGWLEVMVVE